METVSFSQRISRVRCWLIGCNCSEEYPGCTRCQAALYSYDFIERGKLHWLYLIRDLWWRYKHRVMRKIGRAKCHQCGKRFWRGYDDEFCSSECFDDFIPF